MADYTNISNATLEPNAPLISSTMLALRDNPTAIAEGAAGAPRVQSAALQDYPFGADDFQGGTAERDWVLARVSEASTGAVGTYAMLGASSSTVVGAIPGGTVAGSNLRYSTASGALYTNSLSGTWRCMGYMRSGTADATMFLRIS